MAPSRPSVAAVTAYLFGASSAAGGAITLLQPQRLFDFLGLGSRLRVAATTSMARGLGLAAVATGAYYVLAAWQDNRQFLILSAPLRLLAAGVFWREGPGPLRGLAIWQGVGALATTAGLLLDYNKQRVRALRKKEKSGGGSGGGGGGPVDWDEVRETEGSETDSRRKKASVRSRFGRRSGRKSKDEA